MVNADFYSTSMRHYQRAYTEYPELSNYDEEFQESIRGLVQNFHSRGGGDGSSSTCTLLSFGIIKEAITCILKNNTQAANEILACKQYIESNAQILGMVKSYFNLCRTTLDFLSKLQVILGRCRNKLEASLHRHRPVEEVQNAVRCAKGVVDNFFLSLPDLIGKHVAMLDGLQEARDKYMPIHAAEREISTARKVTTIILVTVFATAVICSILAAALHCPPVLVALPAAVITIANWDPFIQWLDGFWVEVDEGGRRRGPVTVCLGQKSRNVAMQELKEIIPLKDNITLADDTNTAPLLHTLLTNMAELDQQIKKCRSGICKAKLKLVEKITEPSRRRDRIRPFLNRLAAVLKEKKEILFEKMSNKFENLAINRWS